MDTANLVLGGLVIGQVVDRQIRPLILLTGLTLFIMTVIGTTRLRKGG